MSRPQILTKEQLNSWNQKIKTGNLSAIGEVYQILQEKGYNYAAWAIGVATGDSITGNGALEFMQTVAKDHKQILTQARIDSVRRDMATGYLAMLQNKLEHGHGGEDITYEEMYEFHVNVFNKNGLDISYWTLYTPMSIIQTNASGSGRNGNMIEGSKVVESMWEQIRATKGEVVNGGASVSLELYQIMQDAQKGYIYVDKITGDVSSQTSIINAYTMDASIHSFGSSELINIISKLENIDKLIDSLGYKKVTISSTDQQKAQQWCRDTDIVATAKSVTTESLNHNIFNLSTHSWYRNYATMENKRSGQYFINHDTSTLAKQQLINNWILVGGTAMTKWIMAAVLNEESINSSNSQITSVNDQNFLDKGLEFVFDSQTGHRQLVPGKTDVFEFKYQLDFIDNTPEYTLNLLKKLSEQGETDKVSIYLNALAHLNPIVILNPDSKPPQRTLADMGEDWIKARCWMIQEIRYAQASEFNQDLDQQFDFDGFHDYFSERPRYQQFKTLIESIRKKYGFSETDTLVFHDKQTGQSWSTNPEATTNVHEIVMLADKNPGIARGGALSDILIGSIGDDVIIGGKGNDLLIGGAGTDNYYFNNGDGQDHIIDSDGNGNVYLNNKHFSSYQWIQKELNLWQSKDNNWQVWLNNTGDLCIQSLINNNDILTINGWNQLTGNKLGISLTNMHPSPSKDKNKIMGDWRTKIIHVEGYFDDELESLKNTFYDGWNKRNSDGSIVNGIKENGFEDVIYGTGKDDEILGLAGGDAIDGMAGNDVILGGDGTDLLTGGGGSDTIKGGAGNDFIFANTHLWASNRYLPKERWQMPASGKKLIYAGPTWGIYINKDDIQVFSGITDSYDDPLPASADTPYGGDFLYGGDGNDHIIGGNLNDYIEGDSIAPDSMEHGDDIIYGMEGNDYIVGGKGNDVLYGDGIIKYGYLNSVIESKHGDDHIDGGDGDDEIIGGGGNDVILGGDGNDKLYGDYTPLDLDRNIYYHGNDTIYGGAGNDVIQGGSGDDILFGGDGEDYIFGDYQKLNGKDLPFKGNDHIWGDAGKDYLYGGYGDDVIYGGDDDDHIFGGYDNDSLYGDDGNDIIWGDDDQNKEIQGDDCIDGGDGNDILIGCGGDDWIFGGDGNDTIWGDESKTFVEADSLIKGNDHLYGGNGNDIIDAGYGEDVVDGGDGDDRLYGGGGNDQLYGGNGNDLIIGDFWNIVGWGVTSDGNAYPIPIVTENAQFSGDDVIYGGDGDDNIYGDSYGELDSFSGADVLYGEGGNDYINGGYGNDYIDGGTGNDLLIGSNGDDIIYGGDGNDVIYGDSKQSINNDNGGTTGNDVIFGGNGDDFISGGNGDDNLQGDDGNDQLYGGKGNDNLYGGAGNDLLSGGKGNDYLNGGLGDDYYIIKDGDGITTIEDHSGLSYIKVDQLKALTFASYENGIVVKNKFNNDTIYLVGYNIKNKGKNSDLGNIIFTEDGKQGQTLLNLIKKKKTTFPISQFLENTDINNRQFNLSEDNLTNNPDDYINRFSDFPLRHTAQYEEYTHIVNTQTNINTCNKGMNISDATLLSQAIATMASEDAKCCNSSLSIPDPTVGLSNNYASASLL